jgi:hypothetical protein
MLIELYNPYEQVKCYLIEDDYGQHETGWGYFPFPPSEWVSLRAREQRLWGRP